jgi:hypothetical protein
MKAIYELNEEQISDLQVLYQNEWWTKGRSLAETKQCVEGSQISIGVVDAAGSQLILGTRVSQCASDRGELEADIPSMPASIADRGRRRCGEEGGDPCRAWQAGDGLGRQRLRQR